jgi:hypothetical protein
VCADGPLFCHGIAVSDVFVILALSLVSVKMDEKDTSEETTSSSGFFKGMNASSAPLVRKRKVCFTISVVIVVVAVVIVVVAVVFLAQLGKACLMSLSV